MATNLFYNGVELRNVLTRDFNVETVFDKSNTDVLYWKYTIAVATVVYQRSAPATDAILGAVVANQNQSAASVVKTIKDKLTEKRKAFRLEVDGVKIVEAYPADTEEMDDGETSINASKFDLNQGPTPTNFKLTQLTSSAFRIEYTIEVCLGCTDTQNPPSVLNNRWSTVDDIDEHGIVTRTWEGRLRLRYAIKPEKQAHTYRALCLPPLAKGFRRKKVRFLVEPNGLELVYLVTDSQIATQAIPAPATMIFGMHSESIAVDASNSIGDCSVTVEGLPGAPKSKLIEIGISFVEQKLQIQRGNGNQHMIQNYTIVDSFSPDHNRIEVRARVRHILDKNATRLAAVNTSRVGQDVDWSNLPEGGTQVNPNISAGVKLAKSMYCALQSPCDKDPTALNIDEEGITQNEGEAIDAASSDQPDTTERFTPDVQYAVVKPEFLSKALGAAGAIAAQSDPYRAFPWQEFRMDTVIDANAGYIALPISGGGASQDSSHAFIQLHRPTSRRTVRISAERVGEWPTMPPGSDITVDGIFCKFLKGKFLFGNQILAQDGVTYIYRLESQHEYAMARAYKASDPKITPAKHAYLNPDVEDTDAVEGYKPSFPNGLLTNYS
jgi:hypothetical protein